MTRVIPGCRTAVVVQETGGPASQEEPGAGPSLSSTSFSPKGRRG